MNADYQRPAPADTSRRSKQVALVLLGTMGVIGGAVVWDAWRRAGDEADEASAQPAPEPVAADRTYNNNHFTPGVGYYHAPYHSWYPFPFNHHDPARGYFAGGLWQAAPFAANLLSSRPQPSAVTSALAAQQRHDAEQRTRASTSNFARPRGSMFGGSSFSSRPSSTPTPSKSSPSIKRGGFGSSGHSSGGSSS